MSKSGLGFAIPNWVVDRELLKKGDTVNFNLPIYIEGFYYKRGDVLWTKWDEGIQAQVSGAGLINTEPPTYPVRISLDADSVSVSLDEFSVTGSMLYRVLKDTAFLKKGVEIYLGHLVPFFSRIAKYPPKEYPQLKDFLLSDVKERVRGHFEKLESLYMTIKTDRPTQIDIAKYIDLEELRTIIGSEIYVDIFKAVFADSSIEPYLKAVKDLEQRLYYNYNIIVLLYLHSLS